MRDRLLLLLSAALLAGCGKRDIVTGIDDSTFVGAVTALRRLPIGSGTDEAVRARSRDSIFQHYGITAAQLESATVLLSRDPERAGRLWGAIEHRQLPRIP